MSVSCWLIIISIIIAFIILILFISKKMCDMAIKTEIAKKYSMLIFTPEQKEVMDKTDLEAIKWLEQNATEVEIISRDGLKLKGYEIKSLLNGKVVNVFKDDKHGMSVRVQSDNNVVVVYSNLDEKISVEKGQEVTEGQILGTVGNTTSVESEDGTHVHIEAFKGEESIDPMTFIK